MTQGFVEDHLKSPSTASFGGMFDGQNHETCVTILGDGLYQVKGWVDSQNAFGATVQADFSLKVKNNGDGNWSLIGQPVKRHG